MLEKLVMLLMAIMWLIRTAVDKRNYQQEFHRFAGKQAWFGLVSFYTIKTAGLSLY